MTNQQAADAAVALSTLIDYYVFGRPRAEELVQEAWETLVTLNQEHLGPDYTRRRVHARFRNRQHLEPNPNVDFPDECGPCHDSDNEQCRFHAGVDYGAAHALDDASDVLRALAEDPEMVGAVLDQNEYNKESMSHTTGRSGQADQRVPF